MIYDRIENIGTYLGIHPNLDIAIRNIQQRLYINWDIGRHEIDKENVFCNSVSINMSDKPNWERHEGYLDIHINLDGAEQIRCTDISDIHNWSNFDVQNDCAIAPYSEKGICCPLDKSCFFIAFPQDAHMPGLNNKAMSGRKVIFKVKYT